MFKHCSSDIERDGHRIEVMIEMQRFNIENNGLGWFSLGFHEVRQLYIYVLFPVVK